jgi:hypothetical protein
MSFHLSPEDNDLIGAYLDRFLKAYANGSIALDDARGDLAYVISAAVTGNEGEFRKGLESTPEWWADNA